MLSILLILSLIGTLIWTLKFMFNIAALSFKSIIYIAPVIIPMMLLPKWASDALETVAGWMLTGVVYIVKFIFWDLPVFIIDLII